MSGIALQATPNGTRIDQFGNALAGRPQYVYLQGTTTQVVVYSDAALSVPLPGGQPVVLQADGSLPGYISSDDALDYVDAVTGERRQGSLPVPSNVVKDTRVTTKGDLLGTDATPALARIGVGSDGLVLTADSAAATGVSWQVAGGGGFTSPYHQQDASGNFGLGSSLPALASGTHNVAIGLSTLAAIVSASNNTGIGYQALKVATSSNNTALGSSALMAVTSGSSNTAIGQSAALNTTGGLNTVVGNAAGAGAVGSTGSNNVAVGFQSLFAFSTGHDNTAIGYQSADAITTANSCVAVGTGALGANTTASSQTAVGQNALATNTTAVGNVAVGANAMQNTTGGSNTALGVSALAGAVGSTGTLNTAIGWQAMTALTTGSNNVAVGYQAGTAITTAAGATIVGAGAGQALTTGSVTALGRNAASSVTTGIAVVAIGPQTLAANTASDIVGVGGNVLSANTTGAVNAAIGPSAMLRNTIGSGNTAAGSDSLHENLIGSNNTAVGNSALYHSLSSENAGVGHNALGTVTTGANNSALGAGAGFIANTGSNGTFIGYNAGNTDGVTPTTDNASMTCIGEQAQATTANVIVLGKAIATRPNLIFGAVGAAALFGSGVGVFAMAPAFTNPSTNPTGASILYVDSATNQFKSKDPAGTVSALSYLANATVTLVAGSSGSVANTNITANSIVLVHNVSAGGTVGALSVTLSAGVGFTINSTSGTDTSKVHYRIVSY